MAEAPVRDGAYDRGKLTSAAACRDFGIEIVRKLAGQQGFHVLPRRWVVERSFGWIRRWRRLVVIPKSAAMFLRP